MAEYKEQTLGALFANNFIVFEYLRSQKDISYAEFSLDSQEVHSHICSYLCFKMLMTPDSEWWRAMS